MRSPVGGAEPLPYAPQRNPPHFLKRCHCEGAKRPWQSASPVPKAPLPKGGWHGEAVTGGYLTSPHLLQPFRRGGRPCPPARACRNFLVIRRGRCLHRPAVPRPLVILRRGDPCGRPWEGRSPSPTHHKIRFRRGQRLPTVVPTDSRPLSRPPIGALPRNRLAASATGGASPISPPVLPRPL